MRKALLFPLVFAAAPAFAQESDKDYLTSFLEDSLSDAGRSVSVTGFVGALPSRATIEVLTIADDNGVWLTLEGVTLDWSQSSLLSGELVINELSAKHLVMARLPASGNASLPAPEASGFSLPELPVSIDIGKLAIVQIELSPAVLGQPVVGQLDAAMALADGTGKAVLSLIRMGDGPAGAITLDAGYDNATEKLDLNLVAGEGVNGLVATALGLPGTPATDFHLTGSGPLSAFTADILLATDGEERLAGNVTLAAKDNGYGLRADLSGNLAPLFLPEYADFLGTRLDLVLEGERAASGALTLDQFHLKARSLSVEGSGMIAADGAPESLTLSGLLSNPDGGPVLLPFGARATRIDEASFQIATSQEGDHGWTAKARISGLDRADLSARELELGGSGRIVSDPNGSTLNGALHVSASDLAPTDAGLAKALGTELSGRLNLHLASGEDGLRLSEVTFAGPGLTVEGELQVAGLSAAFLTSGDLTLTVDDLSRLDALAGLPVAGSGSIRAEGSVSRLSGDIDGTVALAAQDLRVGIDQFDRLLSGNSTAKLSLLRDKSGTTIRSLELKAGSLTAALSGTAQTAGSDLAGTITLADLSALDPLYSGKAVFDLAVTGTPQTAKLKLTGKAERLAIGNVSVDRLLAGQSTLTADIGLAEGLLGIDSMLLSNAEFDLSLTGSIKDGQQQLLVKGKLVNMGLLVPDLSGPLSVSGTILQGETGYGLDLIGRGPGQVDGRVTGTLARDLASADLSISGTGQAGLANIFIAPRVLDGGSRFDLRLIGPLEAASLSGRVTLARGRLSDPSFGFSLQNVEAIADLKSGKAQISATAGLSTGGKLRIEGPVGVTAPFPADLSVSLDRVRFFDPKLYETVLVGKLGIKGPLSGGATISGALTLSETELRVPESGIDAAGILMEIDHRNEPADVRETRSRAGLLNGVDGGQSSSSPAYRLDLVLSAPSRIFLRGRGIDAELGGTLTLGGTTAAVVPSGEFGLIRGRLDILGKRLVLETANLILEGSMVPQLEISASTESDGIQSYVKIEGPADEPRVAFSSVPDLPQEEVLARLLFGRGLDSISALQAAQLAQAVAVLAGRGGEGVISRLRKGFGLDDLDVATAEDGTTAVKAGKYITDNVYTEVEIDQTGTSTINLNLDLRPGVTVKGRVGGDGETGVGIFIEKDY